MKKAWVLGWFWIAGLAAAQTWDNPAATPTPFVQPPKWSFNAMPWEAWFKNNTIVTDKDDYVHFLWNAQDLKPSLEAKDQKRRLEEGALQLVSKLYPEDAKADLVKVDVVYVLDKDTYGQPKWDSLQQVAHFEFHKSRARKYFRAKPEPSWAALQKLFEKVEFF